jgi:hypothetical protein
MFVEFSGLRLRVDKYFGRKLPQGVLRELAPELLRRTTMPGSKDSYHAGLQRGTNCYTGLLRLRNRPYFRAHLGRRVMLTTMFFGEV